MNYWNYIKTDSFFHSLSYKCPLGFNAAEYYISLLGIEADKEMESRDRIRKICDEYSRSDIAAEIDSKVGMIKDETEYFNGETDGKVGEISFITYFICHYFNIFIITIHITIHVLIY